MRDVAMRYGSLFERVDRLWQESIKPDGESKPLTRLPDKSYEEIRQVLYDVPELFHLEPGEVDHLINDGIRNKLTELRQKVDEWRATGQGAPPRAMVLEDKPQIEPSHVFIRGNPHQLGPRVERQFLDILARDKRKPFTQGSGRLELAKSIVDPNCPLTARVIVNRVWMHHFGEGLVRTPSDFGLRGEPPTHRELLDYLSTHFVENGWSIKEPAPVDHAIPCLSAKERQ